MSRDHASRPMRHRSPVARSFRLVLRMPSQADELVAAANLPGPCADLVRSVVRRTRLWPGEKADVARELIDHVRDALAAEHAPERVVEQFGDPGVAAKLIRRARRRQRHPLLRAWTAAVKLTVISPLIMLGVYGILWIRFHAGDPTITTNYAAMIGARWPDAGPGSPPYVSYELAHIRWNDIARALDERASRQLQGSEWSLSPASDVPHIEPGHPMRAEVVRAFRAFLPELDPVAAGATRPGHGVPLASEAEWPETYLDATVAPEDRLTRLARFPEQVADQPPIWNVVLPHLGWMRTNVRLLAFDARLALEDNDAERFTARIETALELARQASNDGFVISDLVAMAIHGLVCTEVGRALRDRPDAFSPDHLARLAHATAGSGARVLTVGFELERFGARDVLQRSFTDNGRGEGRLANESFGMIASFGTDDFGPVPDTYQPGAGTRVMAPVAAVIVAGRRTQLAIIDEQLGIAEACLARGPSAMSEVIAANQALARRLDGPIARLRYFVAAIYSPATDRLLETVFKGRAMSDATLAAIAIESYRREHDADPASLGELVPGYLPEVPEDPFAPGEPLRLWIGGESPVIYSVGQDADDDGGRPMLQTDGDRAQHSFRGRYAIEPVVRSHGRPLFAALTPGGSSGDGDWVLFPPSD